MEKFIRSILARMSTADKIRLAYGRSNLSIGKLEKYGIREVFMADGPQGIRRENGEKNTALPCGIALAASFDVRLAEEYGAVIGEEARACGIRASLGPGVNLMRTPLNGRSFEYYGEDPVLAGKTGAGYVRGCQSKGVAATPKHMALNNQEICRTTGDSLCDQAVLRELYLESFEIICRESSPWMIMTSYNRINGVQASACGYTQKDFLRDECGFDGVTVSDWGGTRDARACILGGQDLEMGGGDCTVMSENLPRLVENGEVPLEAVDRMALNNLRLLFRLGAFEKEEDGSAFGCNTPAHQAFVRKAACECAVLLKNDGDFLPKDYSSCRRIAVIGPAADYRHSMGSMLWCGGSGAVHPPYEITLLEAVRKRWGKNTQITYAPGVHFDLDRNVPDSLIPDGFTAEYFESQEAMAEGKAPFLVRKEALPLHFGVLNAGGLEDEPVFARRFALRLKGRIIPRKSGKITLQLGTARFAVRFWIDGVEATGKPDETPGSAVSPARTLDVRAGAGLDVEIEACRTRLETAELRLLYLEDEEAEIARAVALAAEADQVIYAGGTHHGYDKEAIGWGNVAGADIPDLKLPSGQDELLLRLLAVNPNVTVVLINGSAVDTSRWIDKVPAVVEMFYPGMECGNSVADILEGKAAPGGRLPFSWSDRLTDYPSIANGNYPGTVTGDHPQVAYDEGIFIGYRYMDKKNIAPRFPFGFGL
ncbi:MAG: glycoside hydrolase family 3 protein, partial [Lentisphaeria bacterium]|nr:glycoside hydrolase family 3 protein [Lentisphaeria bacterium]